MADIIVDNWVGWSQRRLLAGGFQLDSVFGPSVFIVPDVPNDDIIKVEP
jgi:hypothetical protein